MWWLLKILPPVNGRSDRKGENDAREMADIPSPVYHDCFHEKINLLWIRPITGEEYNVIVEKGIDFYLQNMKETDIHIFK